MSTVVLHVLLPGGEGDEGAEEEKGIYKFMILNMIINEELYVVINQFLLALALFFSLFFLVYLGIAFFAITFQA